MFHYKKITAIVLFLAVLHFFLPSFLAAGGMDCFDSQEMACCKKQTAVAVSRNCCENMDHETPDPIQDEAVILLHSNTNLSFALAAQDLISVHNSPFENFHFIEIDYRNTPLFNNKLYQPLSTYLI